MNATYRPGPPPGRDPSRFVARAYDRIAARYDRTRRRDRGSRFVAVLNQLMRRLPPGGRVLDLGCGAGYPVARTLTDCGFQVTGLDISGRMLARARRAVPEGTFLRRDMVRPGLPAGSFDGAVAVYSLFHVPWRRQPRVLRAIRRLLVPGGPFLFNLGDEIDREYTEGFYGGRMYWSGLSAVENLRMIRRAGFHLLWHRAFRIGGERHSYYLATVPRRPRRGIKQ